MHEINPKPGAEFTTAATEGSMVSIDAKDGFITDTYFVKPDRKTTAGIICVMEAFGLNDSIKAIADDYAAQGYAVVAPALYDRIERGLILDYDTELPRAIDVMNKNGFDNPLHDVAGCVDFLREQGVEKIGIVGYCYGGTVSWLAASRNPAIDAASCYYGSAIPSFPRDQPKCPTICHWGKTDPTTPENKVAPVAENNPEVIMHWYEAGHGFNSAERDSFETESATLARERTLELFKQHLM